ncbi:MAG: protein kinase [Pseudomonadales bacterium]
MDILGKTVNRYEITDAIGSGAMADVYKAYDPDIDRSVALKILKDEHCVDEEHINRFLREGKAAGALTHPNIVTVHDVGKIDDTPYIMMELLDGQDLGQLLQMGTKFSVISVIKIGMQLASALNYAHDRGVVHRDVKPDNIVIGTDGETVKIADFGIAHMSIDAESNKTQAGMILGTPRYMSPEQATGEDIDGRSDLFSTGVILYELLTQRKAFDADSMPTLIMQVVQKQPTPIRTLAGDVPEGLQAIVNRLLNKKPAKRFQTGNELYEALDKELRILQEEEEERSYIPLEVKWTAIMGAVIAIAMAFSSVLVFKAQSNALLLQAMDSGISLSKFVAVQTAMPVLGEDWITLDSMVIDASNRGAFKYLVISDHADVVRSATDRSLVGKKWESESVFEEIYQKGSATVSSVDPESDSNIANYNLPILFKDTEIGRLNVGLDESRLVDALDTTKRMMIILALAIILSVLIVFYTFNKNIAKNLRLITRTIRIFDQENKDARVSKKRSDEFGDLFSSFNNMASNIQSALDPLDSSQDDFVLPESLSDESEVVEDKTIVRVNT